MLQKHKVQVMMQVVVQKPKVQVVVQVVVQKPKVQKVMLHGIHPGPWQILIHPLQIYQWNNTWRQKKVLLQTSSQETKDGPGFPVQCNGEGCQAGGCQTEE